MKVGGAMTFVEAMEKMEVPDFSVILLSKHDKDSLVLSDFSALTAEIQDWLKTCSIIKEQNNVDEIVISTIISREGLVYLLGDALDSYGIDNDEGSEYATMDTNKSFSERLNILFTKECSN